MSNYTRTIPFLALTTLLGAQEPLKLEAFGAFTQGYDSLKKATYATYGLTAGGGIVTTIPGSKMPLRAGLALATFPGKQHGSAKSSLGLTQLTVDAGFGPDTSRLKGFFGLSLNKWTVKNAGTETYAKDKTGNWAPVDVFAVKNTSGLKVGLRLGANYAVNTHWSVDITIQQTELAGASRTAKVLPDGSLETDPNLGMRGTINPAWIQFGARYIF